jgi:hypothetical protein
MKTILLLVGSNIFMTLAWYGQLKFKWLEAKPLFHHVVSVLGGPVADMHQHELLIKKKGMAALTFRFRQTLLSPAAAAWYWSGLSDEMIH